MCDHKNREAAMVTVVPGTPERHGRDGVWCDPCLVPLIKALNVGGIRTDASCCGHGRHFGWVILRDDTHLLITSRDEAHAFAAWRAANEGAPMSTTDQPCGDYVSDLGLAGPCVLTGKHDEHDDGAGNTWTRIWTGEDA